MKYVDIHRGFTLLESLLAIAVLALAIMALTVPFQAGADAEMEDGRRTMASCLAVEMLEEILSKQSDESRGTPAPIQIRTELDEVADYDGYSETAGNIRNVRGLVITDPAANGRYVEVASVYLDGQDVSEEPTVSRVTVTVAYEGHPIQQLTRYVYANR
jgi:prepilin-type N-terminal cleavage/methylation domain-containing protein